MKIDWTPRAVRHLEAIREYIGQDNPKAAERVARRILHAVELLVNQPHVGRPGRVIGTRELVVSSTPYVIPYRMRAGRLEVIAVFHGRQKWPAK